MRPSRIFIKTSAGGAVTVSPVGIGTASLSTELLLGASANMTAIGVASLSKLSSFFRTFTYTGVGSASATAVKDGGILASSSGTGASTVEKLISKFPSFSGIGAVTLGKVISKTLAATGTGTASLVIDFEKGQLATTAAVGTASLSTLFIPAGPPSTAEGERRLSIRIGMGI